MVLAKNYVINSTSKRNEEVKSILSLPIYNELPYLHFITPNLDLNMPLDLNISFITPNLDFNIIPNLDFMTHNLDTKTLSLVI